MENAVSDRGTVQNLPHSAPCKRNYSVFNKREVWDHKTSLIVPLLIELQVPSHEICLRGINFASVSKVYFLLDF